MPFAYDDDAIIFRTKIRSQKY